MTNKIKFTYLGEYANQVHDKPVPSSEVLPDWFKSMSPYDPSEASPDGKKLQMVPNGTNASAKKCTPMLDAMTGGYTVSLWTDVFIQKDENSLPQISWRVHSDVFSQHGPSGELIPPPPGYTPVVLKYITEFRVETPPGYSIMIKPPAGFYDLPFMPLTAVIDSDSSVIDTNIPVWVRSDVEGVIEKGTPIAQIIPFKREDWEMEVDVITKDQFLYDLDKGFSKTLVNNYVKNHHSKKKYS